jgi:hypothetical protein
MAILSNAILTIVLNTPPTTATVKVRGAITYNRAEKWLMETAFNSGAKWFWLSVDLYGKDSHEGGTDTLLRLGLISKVFPESAIISGITRPPSDSTIVPFDYSSQIDTASLNEDPIFGQADEIYAKVKLTNMIADCNVKTVNSNVVTLNL